MTIIIHASDLHFGKTDPQVMEMFHADMERQKPDLVVLSGNFTHSAGIREFCAARDFLGRIRAPVFCVPGNRDIPRFNLWQRFSDPMRRYRDHIAPMQDVVHEDKDMFVVGINTVRPAVPHWNWRCGMVSDEQVQFVENQFRHADNEKLRVFVCYHPLLNMGTGPMDTVVWGSEALMRVLESQQVDLVLTGHAQYASSLFYEQGRGPVMVGAGRAGRGRGNGYTIIRILPDRADLELVHWNGESQMVLESLSIPRNPAPCGEN